jgi:hypothetical protein
MSRSALDGGDGLAQSGSSLSSQETDVFNLLLSFLLRVDQGAPLSFETFKAVWKELKFSYVLQVRMDSMILRVHSSWLF